MEPEKEIKQLKARMDICEAALEASGYLVWSKHKGVFERPGGATTQEKPEVKGKAED
ncbi:MAG: hypothetical protein ACREB3_00040 [Burkholderiales bacterium]